MDITLQTSNGSRFTAEIDGYVFDKSPAVLDIMADGRFKGQEKMSVIPGFWYSLESLRKYVTDKRPSLKRANLEVLPTTQRV